MYKKMTRKVIVAALMLCVSIASKAQNKWQAKDAVLMTRFAKDVTPDNVLPEYPRPQLVRTKWMNLNGLWEFQPGKAGEAKPNGALSRSILVPFPVEAPLSGVKEAHDRLWYRRNFNIPADWAGQRILLHFGAVDYESEVFVNGKSFGVHTGGYDPFSYDITDAVKQAGPQEILVRVYDPTDDGGFPRGKQTLKPQGIMYTSITGIWQTVWLEPVPVTHIANIKMVPDVDHSALKLTVSTGGDATGAVISIQVKDGTQVGKTITGKGNTEIIVPVPNAKLWSPDQPFLYDLNISLTKNGKTADAVSSYFGMRKLSVENEGGFKKLYLNNKFLFQLGPLDQGFWPDGNYTAPTDAALKYDLEMTKAFGFNMVRKHIKVEPYRWYYWADKLGLMVWQDMPSANSYTEHTPPVDTVVYRSELERMIQTHWNSPSIIMWVVFNEGQGQHRTPELVNLVRTLDPSRVINQASGGGHFDAGDVMDIHSYPPPACPTSSTQALACGEYGGIGYIVPGHIWKKGPTYIMIDNEKEYTDLYDRFAKDLTIFKTNQGLSAAVYTEITDVEVELNGLMTYDRQLKAGVEPFRKSNYGAIHDKLYLTELLPSSQKVARNWQYTFSKPADNWYAANFTAAGWQTGPAGFGSKGTPGGEIRTNWNTNQIWLRQQFTVGNLAGIDRKQLVLYLHHDEDCEVYINGVKAADVKGFTSGYNMTPISAEAQQALVSNGPNTMAIYCKQKEGGQYIDAGISLLSQKPVKLANK